MDYALRFNGVDNHVVLASNMPTSNAGTTAWFIEFRVAISTYPSTGNWYFIGSSSGSASGICLRQASGDGALAVVVGGSFRFATNAGYVPNDGVAHTYRIEHDAGGATRIYKDGVMTHAITYTASASWTLGLFGNTSVGSAYFPFDLISASMQIGASSFSWNASLANGTGLVLPSDAGLNNGTLVGTYINDSQWVGLPEPTKYAMTTVGQGGTAYLAFPSLNVNQNANTFGVAKIRIEFKLDSFQGKQFAAILGGSGSSQTYIRVNQSTMALEWMFGNVLRIESPSNAITLGTRHVIEYTFNKATTTTTITLDGVELLSFAGGSTAGYDQVGRFHSVSTWTPELTLYALSIDGATYLTYQDAWNGLSELGSATGTTWTSVAGNRVLTITEAAGAADSWWVEDGISAVNTITVVSSYDKYTGLVNSNNIKPVSTLSIVSNYPKYSASVLITAVSLVRTASIVSNYSSYGAVVQSTNVKPVKTSNINSFYSKYTVTTSNTNVKPIKTLVVNSGYSKYTVSTTNTNIKPVKALSISAVYAKHTATVNSTAVTAVKSVSVNSSYGKYVGLVTATAVSNNRNLIVNSIYPKYNGIIALPDVNVITIGSSYSKHTASVITNNTKPVKLASVTSSYSKYTITTVIENIDPIKAVSINAGYSKYNAQVLTSIGGLTAVEIVSNYPKYTAQVSTVSLGVERSLSVISTYPNYIGTVVIGEFLSLPNIGGKGAHLIISLGSRDVIMKDQSREIQWRIENARL